MTVPAGIDQSVDVFAVTGFLGAGKTTLIKALLEADSAPGIAVLVSEFGEIGIDNAILADVGEGIVQLQNGCVCCQAGGSLEQTLRDLLIARIRGHVAPFDRLFVETSGISDPVDVVASLHARPVREMRYRMQGMVAAFDSQFGVESLRRSREAGAQLAAADCVVLTKCDLYPGLGEGVAAAIANWNAGAPILRSAMGLGDDCRPVLELASANVSLTPAASVFRAASAGAAPSVARHGTVRSVSIALSGMLDWPALVARLADLARQSDADLLRFKGIVCVDGIEAPVVVHGVRDVLYPPSQLQEWPFPRGESRIVLIYSADEGDQFAVAAQKALAEAISSLPASEKMRAA